MGSNVKPGARLALLYRVGRPNISLFRAKSERGRHRRLEFRPLWRETSIGILMKE